MSDTTGEGGASVYAFAPWARRRARLVQLGLAGGSVVVAAAMAAMLNGTDMFWFGVLLAIAALGLGLGTTWWLGRMSNRVRLEVGAEGVRYDAGTYRIETRWEDVAAMDLVIRGADTGPALVLRGDHAVGGRGLLGAADLGQAIQGLGLLGPSLRSTIPLNAFVEGDLERSPLAADLRHHIPELLDAYLARYGPGRARS